MVVLVTEHGGFSRVESDNATLREIAATHPNVALADWDAALQGTTGQLQSDGIHPSRIGQHLFAKTIRTAPRRVDDPTPASPNPSLSCPSRDPGADMGCVGASAVAPPPGHVTCAHMGRM